VQGSSQCHHTNITNIASIQPTQHTLVVATASAIPTAPSPPIPLLPRASTFKQVFERNVSAVPLGPMSLELNCSRQVFRRKAMAADPASSPRFSGLISMSGSSSMQCNSRQAVGNCRGANIAIVASIKTRKGPSGVGFRVLGDLLCEFAVDSFDIANVKLLPHSKSKSFEMLLGRWHVR
jgi:hypothetical protein